MNAIVEYKQNLKAVMASSDFSLPTNVKPEAFQNAAIIAVQDNPKILQCEPASVMRSIRGLAAGGLVPDGREAALVPFKTKVDGKWIDKCQAMPMVFGLIKMARRSATVQSIRAHIVFQNEVDNGAFKYVLGDEETLTHEPILFGEKGAPVGAYAIAEMRDGNVTREFMDAAQIDKVRRASANQKIYKKGEPPMVSEKPLHIWADWWEEMWKKTVIRRLCKRLDLSSEDLRTIMESDEFEGLKDVTPEPQETPLQRKLRAAKETATPPPEDPRADPPEETIEDAEIITEDPKGEHWTVNEPIESSFPGSDEWSKGMKAHTAALKRTMCPHEQGSQEAADWLGGWDEANAST